MLVWTAGSPPVPEKFVLRRTDPRGRELNTAVIHSAIKKIIVDGEKNESKTHTGAVNAVSQRYERK